MSKYARWAFQFRDGWDAVNHRRLTKTFVTRAFLSDNPIDEAFALDALKATIAKGRVKYCAADVIKKKRIEFSLPDAIYERSTNK